VGRFRFECPKQSSTRNLRSAFYDNRADIKEEDILIVDGLEIAPTVADEDLARFVGKILDYETESLIFYGSRKFELVAGFSNQVTPVLTSRSHRLSRSD
jgi:hypothetical protein